MPFQWTPNLRVGVDEIDAQHKELFSRVNALMEAMAQGKGRTEVEQTIQFLGDYVVLHFDAEEALMARINYPELTTHRVQHTSFKQVYMAFRRNFDRDGVTPTLTLQVQRHLADWLVNHIGKSDKLIGEYIRKGNDLGHDQAALGHTK